MKLTIESINENKTIRIKINITKRIKTKQNNIRNKSEKMENENNV